MSIPSKQVHSIFMLLVMAWIPIRAGIAQSNSPTTNQPRTIVLVAGETAKVDTVGHHDYLAGVKCLDFLLPQTEGVRTLVVEDAWPGDESILLNAKAVVFYTDGGGKQAFLAKPERIATMNAMAAKGIGMTFIHQAVDFPDSFEGDAKSWLGGIYLQGKSGRGHWPSTHVDFPNHQVTHGVVPWTVKDGWLNQIQFVEKLEGITPLVWSGKTYAGSRSGLDGDIVGWTYDRPKGGRSFSFTGLDAHEAWSLTGMRQLMVNGILWTAGVSIPAKGASCEVSEEKLASFLTPRTPKPKPEKKEKASL